MYIVTSKPKRISVNSGLLHCMVISSVIGGRDWGSGSGDCRPAVLARRMPAGQPRKPDQKCMEGQRFISNHATFVVVRSQQPGRPCGQKHRPAGQSVSVEARRRPAGGAGRRAWEDAQKNGRPCRSVAPRVPDRGGQARRSASPGAGGRPTPERGAVPARRQNSQFEYQQCACQPAGSGPECGFAAVASGPPRPGAGVVSRERCDGVPAGVRIRDAGTATGLGGTAQDSVGGVMPCFLSLR